MLDEVHTSKAEENSDLLKNLLFYVYWCDTDSIKLMSNTYISTISHWLYKEEERIMKIVW